MAKFKIGDEVLVARRHNSFNSDGKMDQYVGGVFTVSRVDKWMIDLSDEFGNPLKDTHNDFYWWFHEECLEPAPENEHECRRIMAHYYAEQICEEGGDE
jgi:hypothetical protein